VRGVPAIQFRGGAVHELEDGFNGFSFSGVDPLCWAYQGTATTYLRSDKSTGVGGTRGDSAPTPVISS
jgi:hypothetical protein